MLMSIASFNPQKQNTAKTVVYDPDANLKQYN